LAHIIITEEQAATLEGEVAAILGILEALAAAGDSAVDCADLLRRYAGQIERIALMAGGAGLSGLQDAGLLFSGRSPLTNPRFWKSGRCWRSAIWPRPATRKLAHC